MIVSSGRLRCFAVAIVMIANVSTAAAGASLQLAQVPPLPGPTKVQPRSNVPEQLQGVHPKEVNPIAVASVVVLSTPNFSTADPFSLFQGQQATFRVTLTRTQTHPVQVNLFTTSAPSNPAALPVASSIIVPASSPFADFQATAGNVSTNTTVGVKAYLGTDKANAKVAVIGVKPGTPPVAGGTGGCASPVPTLSGPLAVVGGDTPVYTVHLSCPLGQATTLQVISNNTPVLDGPPASTPVSVAANSTQFTFTARAGHPSQATFVQIRVSLPNLSPLRVSNTLQVQVNQ
jgi:hypothetical protein